MAKKSEKQRLSGVHSRSSWDCLHDKLLSQHQHAVEVGQAPEHSSSPVLSMCMGTDGDAFSAETSSLTLSIIITVLTIIVFDTEITGARLQASMIH